MRRYSLAVRRLVLALTCTVLASLAVAAGAQAVVVNDGGTEAGVALVPSARQCGEYHDELSEQRGDPDRHLERAVRGSGCLDRA